MFAEQQFDEQSILQRIAAGEHSALTQLHAKYWRLIYHVVRKHTGLGDFAEDIAQEVFTTIWVKREELLQSIQNPRAYLTTMAKNLAMRQVKRLSQEIEVTKEFMFRHGRNRIADTATEDAMLERQYAELVKQAVESLTPRQRQIFNLSRYQGLSHDEIADTLNLNHNLVKKHIADALIVIRKKIQNHLAIVFFLLSAMPDQVEGPIITSPPYVDAQNTLSANAC